VSARLSREACDRLGRVYHAVVYCAPDAIRHPAAIIAAHGQPWLYLRRRRSAADLARSVRWALAPAQVAHARELRRRGLAEWAESRSRVASRAQRNAGSAP